jgi:hypothetical protein
MAALIDRNDRGRSRLRWRRIAARVVVHNAMNSHKELIHQAKRRRRCEQGPRTGDGLRLRDVGFTAGHADLIAGYQVSGFPLNEQISAI